MKTALDDIIQGCFHSIVFAKTIKTAVLQKKIPCLRRLYN